MSSHFNYEIDERNLREKLQGMTVPGKEDAWAQFENFSNLNRSAHKTTLPSINFNINRTLILPFVFGGVIILFSLLLFNFISINNKNLSEVVKTKVIPKKQPTPKEIAVVKPIEQPKTTTVAVETPTLSAPVINSVAAIITPPVENKVIEMKAVPVATIAAEPVKTAGTWTSLQEGKIYASPNIASAVIGSAAKNHDYTAVEETNYFIKIAFSGNTETGFGFIRKDALRKNGQPQTSGQSLSSGKRNRKAETLESIKTPVSLSSETSNEPELR